MSAGIEEDKIGQEGGVRDLRFEGFKTPNEILWKNWFQALIAASRLPLPNLDAIAYDRTDRLINHIPGVPEKAPDVLASVRTNRDGTKTLRMRRKLAQFDSKEKKDVADKNQTRGTVIHEIAHFNSPFERIKDLSLSSEEKEQALEEAELVHGIALQSILTGVFLTEYHFNLQADLILDYTAGGGFAQSNTSEFKGNSSNFRRFREETWAELVRLRYTAPEKLRAFEDRQKVLMAKKTIPVRAYEAIKKKPTAFVPLLTPTGEENSLGVDKILCRLTGSAEIGELNSVIQNTISA